MAQTRNSPESPESPEFERVLKVVTERRAEFEERRHIPPDVIAEFKKAGIYRVSTPARFGGDPLPPPRFLPLIERLSQVDGSAGWVASFGSSVVYLAALPPETQAEIYAHGPDVVFAGGLFPVQPAEPVDGGYRVSGLWKFASGCQTADLLAVGISAGTAAKGRPLIAVLRPEQVEIVDNWDSLGLRGTGSHDLRVDGQVVPTAWTFVRGGAPTVEEPLFRYPTLAYASQVLAVVGLGVARAALDHVAADGGRTSFTGAPRPADRAAYRIALGRAEARLRSARAFFYEAAEDAWAMVLAGDPVGDAQTSLLRLSSVHAANTSLDVVRACYQLSGIPAINDGHPMQRCLRDASVIPQHAFLQEGLYDAAGAVLAGVPPFPGYL